MIPSAVLSIVLLGVAGVMIDSHLRDWRRALAALAGGPTTPASRDAKRFARGRRLRRLTASGAIAVVGVLIGVWPILPQRPWWIATFGAVLASLALLIFVLGVADAVASSRYYRAERRRLIEAERREINKAVALKRSQVATAAEQPAEQA